MKQIFKHILFAVALLSTCNIFAQTTCTKVTVTATATASDCRASGKITVVVGGLDKPNLVLATAEYQILSVGVGYSTQFTPNGGVFTEVPPGTYNVKIRSFCNASNTPDDWVTYNGTTTVTVKKNYIEPNMYVVTGEIRKTLNCKVSGMIPISFFDGKKPYHAEMTAWPAGYTGVKTFSLAEPGRLEIPNLPEGSYTFTVNDDCGTTTEGLVGLVGKVASDFPTGGVINATSITPMAYDNTTDCKTFSYIRLSFSTAITSSDELYPYLKDVASYYDIYLSENDNVAESKVSTVSTVLNTDNSINYINLQNPSLIDLKYKDLYPAGGSKGKIFFKTKDCMTTSAKVPFTIKKPYHSASASNSTCTGFDLFVSQYNDYDGIICYPYTANVINTTTNEIVTTKQINSSTSTLVGTVPYAVANEKYRIQYIGADGGEWYTSSSSPQFTMKAPIKFSATASRRSYCTEDGITGTIYIQVYGNYYTTNLQAGTTVEVLSAPIGQVKPAVQTLTSSVSSFYPYALIPGSSGNYSPIVAGTHTFVVTAPCVGAVPETITVDFPELAVGYNTNYSTNTYTPYCAANLGKFYSYMNSYTDYIPGGTRITYKSGPDASAVKHGYPTTFVMPSQISKNFNPFAQDYTVTSLTTPAVTPGTYVFDVWDAACQASTTVSLTVPGAYTVSGLGYTQEHTSCSNMNVYPTGHMQSGGVNTTTYFKIMSATNANGTTMSSADYDQRNITPGQFLSLYKNGTYVIQISYPSGGCMADTFSVKYEQPTPKLDLAKTASYVCAGETKGYIQLVGVGGYGNGPYEYEIVGTNPLQKNETGKFNYGAPNEKLVIKITDKSPKAIALGCTPSFSQNLTMLDLKDASIAYTANNGNFCAGQTINLNCISLGETTYKWTGPNGFGVPTPVDGQFLTIPNATTLNSGWYYVTVTPQNCGESKKDSVFITIHPNPVVPTTTKVVNLCYNTGSYSIPTESGASALSGHTLKWYTAGGTLISAPSVNTSNYANAATYYVSQVNDVTGCESPKKAIPVTILVPPVAPNVAYHPDICYGDSVRLKVNSSNINYTYGLYASSTGTTPLENKVGNNGDLYFAPIRYTTTGTSIIYYIDAKDNVTGCASIPRASRTVTRAASSVATNLVMKDKDTTCINTTITLTANSTGVVNPQYTWFNGTSITSDTLSKVATYTPPVFTGSGIRYYYVSVKGDNLCDLVPSSRKQVSVYVPLFATTSNISAPNVSTCWGMSATLTATTSSVIKPIYKWYTSLTATIPIHEGSTFTTPAMYAATTYYVSIMGSNYCENLPANRKPVTVSLTTGIIPTVANASICEGETAVLTATSSLTAPVYKWYTSTDATTPIFEGNPLVVSNMNASETYYVSVLSATVCETLPDSRKMVDINVKPFATDHSLYINPPHQMACKGQGVSFLAVAGGPSVFNWYHSQTDLVPFYTGESYSFVAIENTEFFVSVMADGVQCENLPGTRVMARVEVSPIMNINIFEEKPLCGSSNGSLIVNVSGGTPPYKYAINNGLEQDENIFTNLAQGQYQISVMDAFNCSTMQEVNLVGNVTAISNALSYGDAPSRYGVASHMLTECVYLGSLNEANIQILPNHSDLANTALNDDSFFGGGAIPESASKLTDPAFHLNPNGDLIAKVYVTNASYLNANLMAWLDFDKNGAFSAPEASLITVVPASTNNSFVEIKWTNVASKLKNGPTYLRLRITNSSIDATNFAGEVLTGEVEDYRLNLQLQTISKTAIVHGTAGKIANIGDIVEYQVTLTNHLPVAVSMEVFDYVPANTEYIASSANPNTATYNNVTKKISWPMLSVGANASATLKFEAKVISYPDTTGGNYPAKIPNIAYAVRGTDTINSAKDCDLAEITVNPIIANDDCGITMINTQQYFDILKNDVPPIFIPFDLETTIGATASIHLADTTLLYKPLLDYTGLDSVEYKLGVVGRSHDSAKVRIAVVKPLSEKFQFCPNVADSIGVAPIPKVTFKWYKQNGTPATSTNANGNKLEIKMGTSDTIFYVAAIINGCVTDSIPINVYKASLQIHPDIRLQVCPVPNRGINLASYLDTTYFTGVTWTHIAGAPIAGVQGQINSEDITGTGTYKFKIDTYCGSSEAKFYVTSNAVNKVHDEQTIVVCHEFAESLHLLQMLGIDAAGSWTTPAAASSYVKTATLAPLTGAMIFNGKQAYADGVGTGLTWNGDADAKMFEFIHTASTGSCIPNKKIKLKIILTNKP